MYATLTLLALVGCAAASPALFYARAAYDDGQWHPELDGSIIGSGAFRWGLEDGSWKPAFDGSVLGRGDLTWLHRRKRSLPIDEPITALAKEAQLIQQKTEATRNLIGGIPLDLPADTPEVAAGKRAHAIAHENQKLATSGIYPFATTIAAPIAATPVAARIAAPVYPYGIAASPYTYASPYYGYGLTGLRTIY